MANSAQFDVVINIINDQLVPALRGLGSLGTAINKTGAAHKEASGHEEQHNKVMNDGVRGTANSTKSFSKLAQTIGSGNNGLVGAYATLAANTFAVSAAFNALRSAQQAELVLKGLEAQGARTGRTFTVVAEDLKTLTNSALSSAEAMAATAQMSAAGFSGAQMRELTGAAMDTSVALGRNLSDSMDRLIKGTTKLEPELLDELGIMTKLTEATGAYSLKVNKSESSLTSFEKRQAFMNAVLEEAKLKFGGVAAEVGVNPYDKLAASFSDLVKNLLNVVNALGVLDFMGALANNTGLLTGAIILFASTIRKDLLGSMNDMATSSKKASEYAATLADAKEKEAKQMLIAAKAEQAVVLQKERNIDFNKRSTKGVRDLADAIHDGTAGLEGIDKAIKSNNNSIASHTKLLLTDVGALKKQDRQSLIESFTAQGEKLKQLRDLEADHANQVVHLEGTQLAAKKDSEAAAARAAAQATAHSAMEKAQNLDLMGSYTAMKELRAQNALALKANAEAAAAAASSGGILAVVNAKLAGSFLGVKNAAFMAATGLKAVSSVLLRLMGYIGIAIAAWDLLKMAFNFFFPETKAQKEFNDALSDFGKISDNAAKTMTRLNEINASSAAFSVKATESLKSEANAVLEIATAYDRLYKAKQNKEAPDIGTRKTAKKAEGLEVSTETAALLNPKTSWFGKYPETVKSAAQAIDIFRQSDKQLFNQLSKGVNLQKLNNNQIEAFAAKLAPQFAKAFENIVPAVDKFNAGIKKTDDALSKFFQGTIQKTPFDDTIDGINETISGLEDLKTAGAAAEKQLGLLSGIGPQLERMLPADLVTKLNEVKNLELQRANLTAEDPTKNKAKIDILTQQITGYSDIISKSKEELKLVKDKFTVAQEAAKFSQLQASYEQARAAKYNGLLADGAASVKAKAESERKVADLQATGLKAQQAILETYLTRNEIEIQNLETKKKQLEQEEQIELALLRQTQSLIEQGQIRNQNVFGMVPEGGTSVLDLFKKRVATREKEVTDGTTGSEVLGRQIEELKTSTKAFRDAIKSLGLSIATIYAGLKSEEQLAGAAALAEAERALRIHKDGIELQNTLNESLITSSELQKRLNGTYSEALTPLERMRKEADHTLSITRETLDLETKASKARIAFLTSMARTATPTEAAGIQDSIVDEQKRIDRIKTTAAIEESRLETQIQIEILTKANIATMEQVIANERESRDLAIERAQLEERVSRAKQDSAKQSQISSIFGKLLGEEDSALIKSLKAKEDSSRKAQDIMDEAAKTQREYSDKIKDTNTQIANLKKSLENTSDLDTITKVRARLKELRQTKKDLLGKKDAEFKLFDEALITEQMSGAVEAVKPYADSLLENFKKLGPDGEAALSVFTGVAKVTSSMQTAFKIVKKEGADSAAGIAAITGAASVAIGAVADMLSSISNAKIAAIDKEIAAEQKRDGKSAESVAKLEGLEKKKDAMARKAFNVQKKLMMAQAVMSTAAGIASSLAYGGPIGIAMAAIVGAMGAAQLAIIAGTQYESSYTAKTVSTPSALSIGKRSDTVDLARGPNASAGGEVGYLRGAAGTGSNASNYNTVGSAYGGELTRGYGNRGFVVGEKGPEIISPDTPISVTPANETQGQAPVNAQISIHAMDSRDVQRVLTEQKGNIIQMLRQAANASGKTFMEDVNVNVYTRPNINKL